MCAHPARKQQRYVTILSKSTIIRANARRFITSKSGASTESRQVTLPHASFRSPPASIQQARLPRVLSPNRYVEDALGSFSKPLEQGRMKSESAFLRSAQQ